MRDQGWVWGQRLTLLVTNATKVAGLVLAIKAAFSSTQPPALELGLAAFMMAGAQLSEETLMGLASRMFGSGEARKPPDDEPPAVGKGD